MRVSLQVEMNAAKARAEAAGLRGEIDKLGAGSTEAGQATGRGAVGVTQLGTASTSTAAAVTTQTTALQQLIAVSTGLTSSTQSSVAAELAHGRALDETRARFDPLFAASRRYEQELHAIAEAERDGALSAVGAGQARARAAQSMAPTLNAVSGTASQSVAQLGFQFNDIGVMLAAGQNPLMLAVQQGTQITQVFDQMKAKGEPVGKSLKTALMGMLSPMNLVTMGAIAMGAVVVSALVGMIGETVTADKSIENLTKSASEFSQEAGRSVSDVTKEFGGLNSEIVEMQKNLTALAQIKALQDLATTSGALKADMASGIFSTQKENVGDLLGSKKEFTGQQGERVYSNSDPAIGRFQQGLADLGTAEGPRNQLAAVQALKAELVAAAGSIGQMTGAQVSYYGKLLETEAAINRIAAASAAQNRQRIELERGVGIENDRMGGPTALDRVSRDPAADAKARLQAATARQSAAETIAAAERENALAQAKLTYGAQSVEVRRVEAQLIRAGVEAEIERLGIQRQGDQAIAMRSAASEQIALIERQRQATAKTAATSLLSDLKQEAEIVKLTAKYGADSLEVAYSRAGAEREAQAALLATQGIAGQEADELMRAWDAARGIASVNMAAGIVAAAGQAQMLAANLGISLQHAIGLMGLASKRPAAATGSSRYTFGGVGTVDVSGTGNLGFGDLSDLPGRYEPVAVTGGSKAKGGGGKKAETDSVLELIRAEERELAVLRETDPVKRELLEKSEQMKGATKAQRSELEGLIRTRMAEKTALEAVQRAQDELKSTMKSAFTGWITGANSFKDALGQVIGKMAEMAASSAFDQIFGGGSGGGGGGGLFGNILSAITGGAPKKADGGRIGGAGGPREDNHLIAVSTGEYIVNAAATANALPLLEALNAGMPLDRLIDFIGGSAPRAFANGGGVNVGSSAPKSWSQMRNASSDGGDRGGNSSGPRVLEQHIHVSGATGNAEIRQMVSEGVQYGIELHDREVLPSRVMDVMDNQRVMGR
ncbi:phage tail length tape measure family protein [Cypionkella sp.]|uniref:phage tail length tape measure family protein n=1 Tax=Cypionkella sp. TaxID=2811411 RepID=UPI00260F8CBC|nr:phage tail length tape measure family protein [Cypionkella sp.]